MARLVAFYSRADENYFGGACRYIQVSSTEKAANMIAAAAGAELFKIEQARPCAADYNTCIAQAKKDQQAKARPALARTLDSLDGYDEICLGYPNYWGDLPMAVYTFPEQFDWSGKIIHPFCTHESGGLSGTERKIRRTCKGAEVSKGLAIHGGAVDGAKSAIEKWL